VIIFFFRVRLICWTKLARVVDLPDPIVPVTRKSPSFNSDILATLSGNQSELSSGIESGRYLRVAAIPLEVR
jgi:hypothetical protein